MTPIYFPFTFVDEAAAARLHGWFEQIVLLAPSGDMQTGCLAPGVDPGVWQVHCPPAGDEASLAALEAELRQWADAHAGTDLAAVLAARDEQSPFSTLPAVSRLRSRIRAGAKGQSPAAKPDPLLTARVFLRLAHGLDRDRAAIRAQLGALADIEKEMLAELRGQPDDAPSWPPGLEPGEDAGAFLAERRLAAWGRLALATGVPTDVFVTDSPAVLAALDDGSRLLRPVWSLSGAAPQAADLSAPRRLEEAIAVALTGDVTTAAVPAEPLLSDGQNIAIFAVAMAPEEFCRFLAAGITPRSDFRQKAGRCLVVWIGRPPESTPPESSARA